MFKFSLESRYDKDLLYIINILDKDYSITLKLYKSKTSWDTEKLIILTPKTVCKYFFIPHISNNTRLQDFREQLAKWSWKLCIYWKIKWEFSLVEYCWVAVLTVFGVLLTFTFIKSLWKVNSVVPTFVFYFMILCKKDLT